MVSHYLFLYTVVPTQVPPGRVWGVSAQLGPSQCVHTLALVHLPEMPIGKTASGSSSVTCRKGAELEGNSVAFPVLAAVGLHFSAYTHLAFSAVLSEGLEEVTSFKRKINHANKNCCVVSSCCSKGSGMAHWSSCVCHTEVTSSLSSPGGRIPAGFQYPRA